MKLIAILGFLLAVCVASAATTETKAANKDGRTPATASGNSAVKVFMIDNNQDGARREKWEDDKTGVVCYVSNNAISCLKIR